LRCLLRHDTARPRCLGHPAWRGRRYSRRRACRRANHRPDLSLKIFFLLASGPGLTSNLRARNLTNRQSAAKLSIRLGVCAINSGFSGQPAPQRNKSAVPGSACSSSVMRHCESRSDSPILARWRAMSGPTTTGQHHGRPAGRGERILHRQPSKKLVVEGIARGATDGRPFQKLPPTAIYCHFGAAKPLSPFQPFQFLSCPSRACRPAWAPG
jgi:hypothetical protein